MSLWVYGGVVAAAMLALTIAALVRDPSVSERPRWMPDWRVPDPDDLRSLQLPTRWFGYDPARVDAILLTTADALEVAYAELGPGGRARLRATLAATGRGGDAPAVERPPSGDDGTSPEEDHVR